MYNSRLEFRYNCNTLCDYILLSEYKAATLEFMIIIIIISVLKYFATSLRTICNVQSLPSLQLHRFADTSATNEKFRWCARQTGYFLSDSQTYVTG